MHVDKEVRARQTLNAEYVLGLALEDGIDWLLHIDSDELFWVPDDSIDTHIARLEQEQIVAAKYLNFEAVPDAEKKSKITFWK